MNLWTDRQFWLDATWRSLRTFAQWVVGFLAAFVMPRLANVQAGQAIDIGGASLWRSVLLGAFVAALVSLGQSIDRGREAAKVTAAQAVPAPDPAAALAAVVAVNAPAEVVTACGDALR